MLCSASWITLRGFGQPVILRHLSWPAFRSPLDSLDNIPLDCQEKKLGIAAGLGRNSTEVATSILSNSLGLATTGVGYSLGSSGGPVPVTLGILEDVDVIEIKPFIKVAGETARCFAPGAAELVRKPRTF
jgi:hypothetical protein